MKPSLRTKVLTVIISFLAAVSAFVAGFAIGDNPAVSKTTHPDTLSKGEARRAISVRNYWTPERMTQAEERSAESDGPKLRKFEPGYKTWGKYNFENGVIGRTFTQARPLRAVGKMFFTSSKGFGDFVCSATAIGGNLVATAGHCAYWPEDDDWSKNILFVPAYVGGDAPFGEWVGNVGANGAGNILTTEAWGSASPFDAALPDDFAIFEVLPPNGKDLSSVVGSHKLGFGVDLTGEDILAVGYPACEPVWCDPTPNKPQYCNSPLGGKDNSELFDGRFAWGLKCFTPTLGGGSSGGPWLINPGKGGRATLVSVNSYSYENTGAAIFGPYLDGPEQALYERALAW